MENVQIDKLLEGVYSLPQKVKLMEFLAARAPELAALNQAIENTLRDEPTNARKLPIHMRRTLMSHNQNRLPRRVLDAIKKRKVKEASSTKNKNITKSKKSQKKKKQKEKKTTQ